MNKKDVDENEMFSSELTFSEILDPSFRQYILRILQQFDNENDICMNQMAGFGSLTLIPAWINDHMLNIPWDEINYIFPN